MASLKVAIASVISVYGICWVFGGITPCRTPDGDVGDCKSLTSCKPLLELFRYTARRQNGFRPSYQNTYKCGKSNHCCPVNLPLDSCGKIYERNRISHGVEAGLFNFPWMAQLLYATKNGLEPRCSGTLINNRYVLTAAHCINKLRKEIPKVIRLGEYNISSPKDCINFQDGYSKCADPPQDIEVDVDATMQLRHKEFEAENYTNDIALIRLKTEAKITDQVSPICLPIRPLIRNNALSNKAKVTGWGRTETGELSEVLRLGGVEIIKMEDCQNKFNSTKIGVNQMCVADNKSSKKKKNKSVGTCDGDSGGPIQQLQEVRSERVGYVQIGVISTGVTCTKDSPIGIHTIVEPYVNWIISKMKP